MWCIRKCTGLRIKRSWVRTQLLFFLLQALMKTNCNTKSEFMNKINSDFLYFPQALEVWLNFQIDAGAAPSIDIRYTAIWMYCQTKKKFFAKKKKELKFNYLPPCFCNRSDLNRPIGTGAVPLIYRSRLQSNIRVGPTERIHNSHWFTCICFIKFLVLYYETGWETLSKRRTNKKITYI